MWEEAIGRGFMGMSPSTSVRRRVFSTANAGEKATTTAPVESGDEQEALEAKGGIRAVMGIRFSFDWG
jgi:hypothetical protein